MSVRHDGNGAAFDKILTDLQNLILSLEIDSDKVNARGKTKENSGSNVTEIIQNNFVDVQHETSRQKQLCFPQVARSNLRNREVIPWCENGKINRKCINHTTSPSSEGPLEILPEKSPSHDQCTHGDVMNIVPVNQFCNMENEHIDSINRNYPGEQVHEDDNSEYIMVRASGRPLSSKQDAPESKYYSQNDVCVTYQHDGKSNTETAYKTDDRSLVHNNQQAIDKESSTALQHSESIHRSSPLVRRKAKSDSILESGTTEETSATFDGRTRFNLPERVGNIELFAADEPYTSKTLSLKRVLSKKFSPFRRKPKLKPVKSLPTTSQHSVFSSKSERLTYSLRLKRQNDNKETLIFKSPISKRQPRYQRSISIDHNSSSLENSQNSDILEQDPSPAILSKKRKSAKFFFKSQRNFHKSEQSSVDSQDSDMKYSSGISEETGNESDVKESRFVSDGAVVMRKKKAGDSEKARGSSEQRPHGSPIIRRSTIGSSYSRESGASSPNKCQNRSSSTDEDRTTKGSSKNLYNRHSLHVMKDQAVTLVHIDQNRWSNSEHGLVKDYAISAQLMALENDKHYKTGNFKSRSIFQKSIKSGSKSTNMTFAEKKKLSERTWNSIDPFIWGNLNGQRVEISEVDLLSLSESECIALQKVAEQRLREIDLGVSITVPKDESKLLHGKHNTSVLRRAGVHLPLGGTKNKSKKEPDHVFSIPLVRVVENDQLLRLQTVEQHDDAFFAACNGGNDNDSSGRSSSDSSPKISRRMSSSLDSYADQSSSGSMPSAFDAEAKVSSPSTPPSGSPLARRKLPGSRKTLGRRGAVGLNTDTEIDAVQSKLLESLMISETSTKDKKRSLLPPTMAQVPYVVQKCCAHILKHGLDITGIFRIAGSKKRVRQLRQEFDHGVDVRIDEDYHAHDVAALLKEFFRDLPEALLTRELYQAFISTAKLSETQRLDALRCLVWLLPMPNRDTLQQLLSFLATVAEYSEDRVEATGRTVPGNKMSVANLSVIFGPNVLHRYKKNPSGSDTQYQVQSLERAEESTYVIKIVDDMIRSHRDLFMIPRETHDEILRTLQESDPDAVDFLLRRKAANYAKSPSPKFSNEKLDSPSEEPTKGFHHSSPGSPHSNDVNNNNKNSNNSVGREPETYSEEINHRDGESSGSTFSHSEEHKYSTSLNSTSNESSKKGTSQSKNSLTFTEEDLKDILNGDRTVTILDSTMHGKNEKYMSLVNNISDAPPQVYAESTCKVQENSRPQIPCDALPNKPAPQSKTVFPKRQGFSLAPFKDPSSHNSDIIQQKSSIFSRKIKKSRRTKPPSPIALSSASATSGFEDMSSTSSESLCSNRPPTPKQRKNVKIHNAVERGIGVCSDSESSMETRLQELATTSKSNFPLHALRIDKQSQHGESLEDNIVELGDLVPRTFRKGRRLSKDDLYLTQQDIRRRLQRQRSIII